MQSACFPEALSSSPQSVCNNVEAQFNSLTMVTSIRQLMCGLQCFCIDTVLLPFQLTHSNDVSSRYPVIQVDRIKTIEKVVVETAVLFMNGLCCSIRNQNRILGRTCLQSRTYE